MAPVPAPVGMRIDHDCPMTRHLLFTSVIASQQGTIIDSMASEVRQDEAKRCPKEVGCPGLGWCERPQSNLLCLHKEANKRASDREKILSRADRYHRLTGYY